MKKILLCFVFILNMLLLVACSDSQYNSLEDIKNNGVLVVGTSADYAPYSFHTLQDGKDTIVGFEIEIAQKIADELGVELSIVDTNFDSLLTFLNNGQVDMVIAGLSPTPERAESVDFSDIYYSASQSIIVRTEDLDKYNSIEDFANTQMGVQRGSLQEMIFNKYFYDANAVSLTKIPNIILELQNGTIDSSIIEYPVAKGYVTQFPELSIANVELPSEEDGGSAIAVNKGNTEFLNEINRILNELIEDGSIEEFVYDATLLVE